MTCPHPHFSVTTITPSEDQKTTYFITTVKKQDEFDICFAIHDPCPALQVILVPREAVDEEAKLAVIFLHGLLHRLEKENKKMNSCIMEQTIQSLLLYLQKHHHIISVTHL